MRCAPPALQRYSKSAASWCSCTPACDCCMQLLIAAAASLAECRISPSSASDLRHLQRAHRGIRGGSTAVAGLQ
jgi:hypothetical protein